MLQATLKVLARKVGKKAAAATKTAAKATPQDVALLRVGVAKRRAAILKAMQKKAVMSSSARRVRAPQQHIASHSIKKQNMAKTMPVKKARHTAVRAPGGAGVGVRVVRVRNSKNKSKKNKKPLARKKMSSRKRNVTFPLVSDATSWVSVMSAALKKRIAQAARDQQRMAASSVAAAAPLSASAAPPAQVSPRARTASLAAYEVKDDERVEAIIAEFLAKRSARARRTSSRFGKKKASSSSASSLSTPPSALAAVSPIANVSATPVDAPREPSTHSKRSKSSRLGLLPAPNTFLSRDWVEFNCDSVASRLGGILAERSRAVAPATPPSTRPLALSASSPVHVVTIDATAVYTQTLLNAESMEKRIRAQLHAPIFDVSMTQERVNAASRWETIKSPNTDEPPAKPSAASSQATITESDADDVSGLAQVVVAVLTTCSPTEAAAVEAGWTAYYVQTQDKPLFSVAELHATPSCAVPKIHLTSAAVARVVVLSADESRQYHAQTKARTHFVKSASSSSANAETKTEAKTETQKETKSKSKGKAKVEESKPAAVVSSHAEDTASEGINELVEDALKCALENTKTEIATFVRVKVREAFAECEAVRQERHDLAWRRYQQRLVSRASRRRGVSSVQQSEMAAAVAGTPPPVFLEASQHQIDAAVSKAVDLAIGKLHNMTSDDKTQ